MSDNAKKGLLIGVIVIALLIAGFAFSRSVSGDKPEVIKKISMPPGYKSERQRDIEAQQGKSPAGAPPANGDKDLGGDLR